mmetsp:Transcript_18528/g.30075  ORF Transcript_18528/g.30075 Transcript_18528/m.30075 type:complete len:232 (-) Transcript_18528:311-1006(-)
MNFSAPKSAPKPASVTVYSASFKDAFVAMYVLQPWAIFAKGPPWIRQTLFSRDCTTFGLRASFNSAVIAPSAFKSLAVIYFRSFTGAFVWPMTMRPSRSFKSLTLVAKQRIAITSDATTISKPSSRTKPLAVPPRPIVIFLKDLSFMSSTRLNVIKRGSMFNSLPCWIWLSIIAASRLFAAVMAWKSPVKCRLMSSIGTTCAIPPPAAPPLVPKTGPNDGSRVQDIDFLPI